MHRHPPIRNTISKGIKIKHVLRICFLVAVCCWLIFQITRFCFKKIELKYSDNNVSLSTKSNDEFIKLGRKDLQPKEIERHEEEEEVEDDDDDDDDEQEYGQSHTENERNVHEAREENYRADDASSEVTHQHENQTLDNNIIENLERFSKSTILKSNKLVNSAAETEDPDEVQQDAIDSTDFSHLE